MLLKGFIQHALHVSSIMQTDMNLLTERLDLLGSYGNRNKYANWGNPVEWRQSRLW